MVEFAAPDQISSGGTFRRGRAVAWVVGVAMALAVALVMALGAAPVSGSDCSYTYDCVGQVWGRSASGPEESGPPSLEV